MCLPCEQENGYFHSCLVDPETGEKRNCDEPTKIRCDISTKIRCLFDQKYKESYQESEEPKS